MLTPIFYLILENFQLNLRLGVFPYLLLRAWNTSHEIKIYNAHRIEYGM